MTTELELLNCLLSISTYQQHKERMDAQTASLVTWQILIKASW